MRKVTAVWGALAALILVLLAPIASASEQETFYLGPDGFPQGSLVVTPLGGEMPNYDFGRDVEPGLLLEKSDLGLAEVDETKYQHWQTELSGRGLSGYPSVVIWSAPARFDAGKNGVFSVFLLDCPSSGSNCTELGAQVATVERGSGANWVETTVDFPAIDHQFTARRYLGVRIVVSAASETDMMFAYGYPKQRSRLTVYAEQPVSQTVTTVAPAQSSAADVQTATDTGPEPIAGPPVSTVEADEPGSVWAWLITMAVSTALLAAVGSILMSALTRPGRHERSMAGAHSSDSAQTRRISVSAR